MRRLAWLVLLLFPLLAMARVEIHQFDDPAKEARYKRLIEELRCLVCQNQNLADSNAELAQDMRRITYEMVARGESDEKVIAFMVERYGEFVLYRPPFQTSTAMLWVGPFIILGVAVLLLLLFIRRRAKEKAQSLTAEDHLRARQLLDDQQT
ncbi:MAG: cytochrome c-type biogenesis protein CcmH [Gammaproteobacteria bacterium]|nr:cytochrome c-type biogenesis protein CcmH [Gammaproteobacteria bacterium]MCB1863456.1 cytochrome c-type biogenesis protein CcmH [Gammaproteobacteria bacterium]MCB1873328.1 cytochrome c-type biogenesis protein CcmH [Gammaproteobacteria bacterium]MCB1881128.1 cytochrome c-type biogenesis protein CcmH [Gammaproteobacteria bacterium]MCB1905156.1 cytochrome c-type biogenesis protein CcmH [Gammaproteobacteria bacterium]